MRKLIALLIPLLLLAAGGCTKKNQLLTLTAMSKTAALGRKLMSEACDQAKEECLALIKSGAQSQPTCPKLKKCDAAEKKVYAAVGTLQVMAESTAAVLKAGDDERGAALLAEVIRRLGLIRDILKNWGVEL